MIFTVGWVCLFVAVALLLTVDDTKLIHNSWSDIGRFNRHEWTAIAFALFLAVGAGLVLTSLGILAWRYMP